MGLLPSIASTLSFSMPAGPVGMVWGWLVASCFIFIVSLAMVCSSFYLLQIYQCMLLCFCSVFDNDFAYKF